ncbi:transglutaminase domain-containing protein [Mediterraneibacter sp. ICN-202921]|uniref:transglutaminase domain-containing protein n=1 Tax=Mediterraneibacter sp. ICN-202921 TaxID=3134657 RepID=UPI0030C63F9F
MKRRRTERKWGKKRVLIGILVLLSAGIAVWNIGGLAPVSKRAHKINLWSTVRGEKEIQRCITETNMDRQKTADQHYGAKGFYYQKLTAAEQDMYYALWQGVKEELAYIELPTSDGELAAKVYEYLLYDRPELFWCDGTSKMTIYETTLQFYPGYHCTGEQKKEREAQIQTASKACLDAFVQGMTEYEQIRYIFDYLVKTVEYDSKAPDNQNIYSALVNKKSVCAGYARAAQYLLQQAGMECIYVVGDIVEQGAHAWNIVNCEGKYYQMDVTFGDPVFLAVEENMSVPQEIVNYDYLCCTDEVIIQTHRADESMGYPVCSSDDLHYYRMEGMYYETFDAEEIRSKMRESFYLGETSFTCKFSDHALYLEACSTLIGEVLPAVCAEIAEYHGVSSVRYTYVEDEDMNKIMVFWEL